MKFTYTNGSTPLDGYTIRRGVGVGGFGEVYFATTGAGKEVALKRIQRNLDIELRGVAHCLNLKHPNLLQLFDVRQDHEGETWVVMEFVSGRSLRDVLDLHPGGLPRDDAERWFAQLVAAVGHLHANGIVHRDLKPANVFDDGGIVKLGDYGLSKFISCSRRGGHTESVGTFHYMAPEIGRGEYGKEIDYYALGIVLYELLTGRVPFDGESGHEIVMKHLTALPNLSIVPEPYRSVVAQSLEKNPQARQTSVSEILQPLGWAIDSQGLARPATLASNQHRPTGPVPAATASPSRPKVVSPSPRNFSGIPEKEEPLLRAVRQSADGLYHWWHSLEHNPWTRFGIVLIAIIAFFIHSTWLTPVLTMFVMCYIPYYIVRQMVLDSSPQPGPPLQTSQGFMRPGTASASIPPRMPKRQWLTLARRELGAKPMLVRSAELTGAWATSTIGIAIAYVVAALVISRQGETSPMTYAPLVWSASVALLGTWMTLGFGKLWESRDGSGEGILRRLILLAGGATLGTIAFGLADYLLINGTSVALGNTLSAREGWLAKSIQSAYTAEGNPLLGAYALHFALLLAALRWWRPADPLRGSRVSLWSVAVAVVAGWLVQQIAPIPQPWGMISIGAIALAVQVSAPWVSPAARVVG